MEQRRYSLSELDQMRENLRFICRDASIAEDQLRTYMLNGTEPEELAYRCFEEMQARFVRGRENLKKLRFVTNNDPRWMA